MDETEIKTGEQEVETTEQTTLNDVDAFTNNIVDEEAVEPDEEIAVDKEIEPTEEDDLSWVPESFRTETGELDGKKAIQSYNNLRAKLSERHWAAPASPDDYKLEFKNEKLFDDDQANQAKQFLHEVGVPAEVAPKLIERYEANIQNLIDGFVTGGNSLEKTNEALAKEWGKDFERNYDQANQALNTYLPDIDIKEHPNLALDPVFIKLLANIGRELKEDIPSPAVSTPSQSVEELEAEYDQLLEDPAYWDEGSVVNLKAKKLAKKIWG